MSCSQSNTETQEIGDSERFLNLIHQMPDVADDQNLKWLRNRNSLQGKDKDKDKHKHKHKHKNKDRDRDKDKHMALNARDIMGTLRTPRDRLALFSNLAGASMQSLFSSASSAGGAAGRQAEPLVLNIKFDDSLAQCTHS